MATGKKVARKITKKSDAIRKEYPNFNVVSRDQQKRKVDKVTGNIAKEYALTPGENKRLKNLMKQKGAKSTTTTTKSNAKTVSRDQQSRKVDKVTGNVKAEYAMTPGERRNYEYYLKRKGLKK